MSLSTRTPAIASIGAMSIIGVAIVAFAGCAREPSGDVRSGPGDANAIEIVMDDDAFGPDRLRLEAAREVTVEVTNEGGNGHNFTIDELDLSTGTVEPGDVMTATFTVPNGTTVFRCTFHPGMDGEIVAT